MPTADQHQSSEFVRACIMGPSGTGKSGALLSLLLAGYEVGVVDMDNGLDWLVNKLRAEHPELLKKLSYQTFKDKYKLTNAGPIYEGVPKAYTNAVKAMEKWDDGTVPSEWGPNRIFVLDSLTFFGEAAWRWRDALMPVGKSGFKDNRAVYGEAQNAVADILDAITSPAFQANVLVLTHVRWRKVTDEKGNVSIVGGGPSSIGEALTDRIGTYFNTMGLCENNMGKRTMRFHANGLVDLKTSAVNLPPLPLPIDSALATFFKAAKGG